MEPVAPARPDDDVYEIVALLRTLTPDDPIRQALLPFLRLYVEHHATAASYIARPRKRTRHVSKLCGGLAALVQTTLPAVWAAMSL